MNLEEDPSDPQPTGLFNEYRVSSYILNNSGNFLINCIGYWLMGYLILFFGHCLKHTKMKLMLIILEISRKIFVWNYVLSTFLSSYQNTILYVGVALKWNSFNSSKGISNFVLSIITGIFALIVPMLIYKQVNRAKIWQEEAIFDKSLSQASYNSKKLTQIRVVNEGGNQEGENIFLESVRESSEDENWSPLLDMKGLPQRREKKKQSTGF